jgi:hypothetical protein
LAEVGSVYIRVRALTDKVAPDIQKAFSSINPSTLASTGENLGKSLSNSISKNINGNVFDKIGKSLADFGGEAGSARNKLYELTKSGYISGTALTVVLGAVSSLIGGLAGLVGAVGGAIPAVMGLVGAFVSLRVGLAVGQLALSGISQAVNAAISQQKSYAMSVAQSAKQIRDLKFALEDANHAVGRANLNFEQARANLLRTQDLPASSFARREALQQYADAELALREAKQKSADALAESKNPRIFTKTPDPFAGLTDSQKAFAKYILSIQDDFKALKEAAASGFLPILQTNIQRLVDKAFPVLRVGLKEIGRGLGDATTNLTNAVLDPGNLSLLRTIMHNIATDLPVIGTIIGNVYGSFLTILKESHPLVLDFLNFLNTKTKSLEDWLKAKAASGEMATFFDRSKQIMTDLGKIFENVFGTLGAIIKANFAPGSGGDIMIQWLKDVTGKWAALDDTVKGRNALDQYFKDTATNSKAILGAVGKLVEQFIILGANQNIGKTFDALAKGAPAMGELAQKLVDAGPSMGQLVADITTFINEMTDTQAIKNFFGTIDNFVKGLNGLLQNPMVGPILKILGQIHAAIFGLIFIAGPSSFLAKYVGETLTVFKKLGSFLDKFKFLDTIRLQGMYALDAIKAGFMRLGPAILEALAPVGTAILEFFAALTPAGWIAIAVVAITGFFAWFFTQTDLGKQMFADMSKFFSDVWANVSKFLIDGWNNFINPIKPMLDNIATVFKVTFDIISTIGQIAFALLVTGALLMVNALTDSWNQFVAFLKPIFNAIGGWWNDYVVKPITDLWNGMVGGLKDAWANFIKVIMPAIAAIGTWFHRTFDPIISWFKTTIINPLIGFVESFINGFINGLNFMISKINAVKVPVPDWMRNFFGGAKEIGFNIKPLQTIQLTRLAQGGTVMPSPGGTLAQIAEAGRPERVEPLDANGLSNRDKAMIEFLSKNQAAGGRPIQLNVYPAAGMDERELAAIVSRTLAFELRKGGM